MWEAIRANRRRSAFLILALAGVLVGLGYGMGYFIHPMGGLIGLAVALGIWFILFLTALGGGRRLLLGGMKAREIQHDDYPVLFNVVEEMSIAAGLSKVPRVFVIDSDAPNAFAVGSEKSSAVAVTTGLLMHLSRDELQGVVAHEIGHVVNHDTRFMTLAGVMVAAIVLIADAFLRSAFFAGRGTRRSSRRGGGGGAQLAVLAIALVLAILAPLMAQLLYFACSRRREYLADACSARFTRYPPGLASALEKISASTGRMKNVNRAVAPMFTVSPLKRGGARTLFSTHPPTQERVRVLRSMAGGAGYADYEAAYSSVQGKALLGRRTLAESDSLPGRQPSAEPEKDDLEKARDAVDILHRLNGYLFLSCLCGLKTKVPPSYKGSEVHCPRCGRAVPLPAAVLAGAVAAGEIGKAAAEQEEVPPKGGRPVVKHSPAQWSNFRCDCGWTVQLSPNFQSSRVRCSGCGRTFEVEHA